MSYNLLKKWIVNNYPQLGWLIKYHLEIEGETDSRDLVFGANNEIVHIDYKKDGDWLKPVDEIAKQDTGWLEAQKGSLFDSVGCTGYGTLNAIELLAFIIFNEIWNKSDRYTNKASGNSYNGNLVSRVLESVRKKHGLVNEQDWPWDRQTFNWAMYYAQIKPEVFDKGKIWLKDYDFKYERIGTDHNSIKVGLRKSPVPVGVYAWYKKNGKYYSVGNPNHWAVIVKQNWGESYIILDSYPPFIKVLDWDFKFHYARNFYLSKKSTTFNMQRVQQLISDGRQYLLRPDSRGEFYKINENGLEFVPDIKTIAKDLAHDLAKDQDSINDMLKFLTQNKKIKWATEKEYHDLRN